MNSEEYKQKSAFLRKRILFVLIVQKCNSQNHGEAVYEIRSLSAVWNQYEVLNVINPKEKYTLTRDAMRLTAITYTTTS